MNQTQWEQLLAVVAGQAVDPPPVGFVIDSPWLPPWAGISTLDYYASESKWLEANLQAVRGFPDVCFLPGFWSEYGMCTEPSAFGARCVWHENDLPFADKTVASDEGLVTADAMAKVPRPDPRTDGLLPLVLKRLVHARSAIEAEGHAIRFAVARGPLNIASFLLGTTELMMALRLESDACHGLLRTITDFLVDWLRLQKQAIDSIDGIFLLDDLVGFLGEDDYQAFAAPYLKESFAAFDAKVRFFHNDANGSVCAPHLAEAGVNLFNFGFEHSLADMRRWLGPGVAMLGNIPPRDVLGRGTPDDVRAAVRTTLDGLEDKHGLMLSCGGGVPPGVSTENMRAFVDEARQ
ncbi:MAG: uroporphyrinogen decarboxylase [Planctomycetes bacterium ADurb.Bin126]|nr:MAG: uroporphyrinogen decarboxylase [Planctomycetes bacterium ADurb.Bin126]HOD81440.1 uroporphyrinogen decarboxylase family protein [Phycisphaerae bacterium]